jgi:hypothetical protein
MQSPFWRLQVCAWLRPQSSKWRCHSDSLRPCHA